MKPEPVVPFQSEADEEFYNSLTTSRSMALHRLKRTYDNLDRRIQRIEGIVTARERDDARRVLSAAALTYVAAAFMAVMMLLRFILLFSAISRD